MDAGVHASGLQRPLHVLSRFHPDRVHVIHVTRVGHRLRRLHTGHGQQFVVLPGHLQLEVEEVVRRAPGFLVVRKIGEAAGVAVEQDPRG